MERVTMPMRLSRDVTVMFNGGGRAADGYAVSAKVGTHLTEVHGGTGASYAIPVEDCIIDPGVAALFKHDSAYHYVWAPLDAIEEIE
jgi:hypothetical protein